MAGYDPYASLGFKGKKAKKKSDAAARRVKAKRDEAKRQVTSGAPSPGAKAYAQQQKKKGAPVTKKPSGLSRQKIRERELAHTYLGKRRLAKPGSPKPTESNRREYYASRKYRKVEPSWQNKILRSLKNLPVAVKDFPGELKDDILEGRSAKAMGVIPSVSDKDIARAAADRGAMKVKAVKAIDYAARPSYAISAATKAGIKGKNVLKGAEKGIKGEDRGGFTSVLKEAGVKNRVVRNVVGFGADVVLDPTTYLTVGASTPYKVALASAEKAAFKKAGTLGLRGAEREAFVKAAVKKAAPQLEKKARNKGVQVGVRAHVPFTKKTFEKSTSGNTSAKVMRHKVNFTLDPKGGKSLSDLATAGRNTRPAQLAGTNLAPDFKPAGVSDAEWGTIRTAGKKVRADKIKARDQRERFERGFSRLAHGKLPRRSKKMTSEKQDRALMRLMENDDMTTSAARRGRELENQERAARQSAGLSATRYKQGAFTREENAALGSKHATYSKRMRRKIADSGKQLKIEYRTERGKLNTLKARKAPPEKIREQRIKVEQIQRRIQGQGYRQRAASQTLKLRDPKMSRDLEPFERLKVLESHPSPKIRADAAEMRVVKEAEPKGHFTHMRQGELDTSLWDKTKQRVRYGGGRTAANPDRRRKLRLPTEGANKARGYPEGHPENYSTEAVRVISKKWEKGQTDAAVANFWTGIKARGRPHKTGEALELDESAYKISDQGKLIEADAKSIADPRTEVVVLPRGYVNAAEEVLAPLAGNKSLAREEWNKIMGKYKFLLTVPMPGYHARNIIGDTFNAWLGDARAAVGKDATKMLRGRHARNVWESSADYAAGGAQRAGSRPAILDQTIKVNGVDEKVGDLLDEMEGRIAIGGGFIAEEAKMAQAAGRMESLRKVMQNREDWPRALSYLSARQRGMTPEQASKWVDKHHFDYGDITNFERGVRSTLIPFYTFAARNARLQIATLFQRPGKLASVTKFFNLAARAAGYESYMDYFDGGNLEPYQKLGMPIPLKIGGKTQSIELALPMSDLKNMSLSPEEQANLIVGRMSALKLIFELPANYSFFFRDKIAKEEADTKGSDRRPAPSWIGEALSLAPGLRKMIGLEQTEKNGKKEWTWPARTDYVFKQLPETTAAAKYSLALEGRGKGTVGSTTAGILGANVKAVDRDTVRLNALYDFHDQVMSQRKKIRKHYGGETGKRAAEYKKLDVRRKAIEKEIKDLSKKMGRPSAFDRTKKSSGGGGSSLKNYGSGGGSSLKNYGP